MIIIEGIDGTGKTTHLLNKTLIVNPITINMLILSNLQIIIQSVIGHL